MTKILPREHGLQTQIINYLRAEGFYVQRLNAGKYPMGEGRFRRWVQGVAGGTPDIMAFRSIPGMMAVNATLPEEKPTKPGGFIRVDSIVPYSPSSIELYFFEVKRPGLKATPLQLRKMKELEEHGARCFVVHSYEEVEEIIHNS